MRLVTLVAAGALLLRGMVAAAAVHAWIDHPDVAAGDPIELMLEHDGATSDAPDLGPLKRDFDVIASTRSSNVQIINGAVSAGTQLQLSLAPKRSGPLTVPAISWGGETSLPLQVNVGSGSADGATHGSRDVFIEERVEPSQPYVQAAVNLVVRLYAAVPLHRASLDLPANADVLVQQVGTDANTTTERNGRRYQMIERHYVLFPQHSGRLEVAGVQLDAQVAVGAADGAYDDRRFADIWSRFPFGGLWGRMKALRLHGDALTLDVRPRPAGAYDRYWLPARSVTLTGEWHPDRREARVGDPLTLTLHLEALGLTGAQLPDLAALLDLPPDIKAYPDQAKLANVTHDDTVLGRRDQSVALIADRPGVYTLPALRVRWWDTHDDAPREITFPGEVLNVLPALGAGRSSEPDRSAATPAGAATGSAGWAAERGSISSWRALALGLAALWGATALAWWWTSRRRPPTLPPGTAAAADRTRPPAGGEAWRRLRDACARNDPASARRALLDWSATRGPEVPPRGLQELGLRPDLASLGPLLRDLDRACYAGGEWQGEPLFEALRRVPVRGRVRSAAEATLGPLYDE